MPDRIPVFVYSEDPIYEAGLTSELRNRPELVLTCETHLGPDAVAVVASDEMDTATTRAVRALLSNTCTRVVVVLGRLDDATVIEAVGAGACGLLRRAEATPERLVEAVRAARRGDGTLPPDLLGRLLQQVGRIQREGGTPSVRLRPLAPREVEVLRLLAEGFDTGEVARKLAYSERTVKNVLHAVTTRLQLRNRTHAVAYALREGLI